MSLEGKVDLQAVLDGLGQGVVIFSSDGKLVMDNLTARTMLGTDLNVLRAEGWSAASALFNTRQINPDETIDAIRSRALKSERPVRFNIFRSGEYLPCWAAAVQGSDGDMYTMITLEQPDWKAMTDVMTYFRSEMREAIGATQGHIDLIKQSIKVHSDDEPVEVLGRRVNGFSRIISIHMSRVGRLLEMLERLEDIRTGRVREIVRERRRKVVLSTYFEDFTEELDEIQLVDPETDAIDHRSRLKLNSPNDLSVSASSFYLTRILHDILRNAIMYSMKATPITITAQVKNQMVQIDVTDEGYGIRERERDRVFEPFKRARQPQIIGEFGYGLNLYLCKHEIEAMNGRLWFDSEEGVGTTFSLLPHWIEEAETPKAAVETAAEVNSSASSSDSSSASTETT